MSGEPSPRGLPRTIAAVIARMETAGTLAPLPRPPDAPPATPAPREAYGPPQASDVVPGRQRLTYGGLAQWERGRTEIREHNTTLLARDVVRQRAEIAAAKVALLTRAHARETAEAAPAPVAAAPSEHPVGSIAWHREQARVWAAENRHKLTDGYLQTLTAQARGRIADAPK